MRSDFFQDIPADAFTIVLLAAPPVMHTLRLFPFFIGRRISPSGAVPKVLNLEIAKNQKLLHADPPHMHAYSFFIGIRAGPCTIVIDASLSSR